jgi:RNA polymerase sigma-70 factor, ECF subfamily
MHKVVFMVEDYGRVSSENEYAQILADIAQGDFAQFEQLYNKEKRRLYQVITNIIRDPGAAEDALQEAFVRIWRNAARYDREKGSPKGWIATIARNVALDALRSKRQFVELDAPEVGEIEAVHIEPSDPKLEAALKALPPDQCRAIVTMYQYGFSHTELAAHMGAPLGSVKSWIRRGSETLKSLMESDAR